MVYAFVQTEEHFPFYAYNKCHKSNYEKKPKIAEGFEGMQT